MFLGVGWVCVCVCCGDGVCDWVGCEGSLLLGRRGFGFGWRWVDVVVVGV